MTPEEALARQGIDPATARHVPHRELEQDLVSGGYAFEDDQGRVLVIGHRGGYSVSILHAGSPTPEDVIQQWLSRRRHADRPLDLRSLGLWQQAAVTAAREGCTVADLDLGPDARLPEEDLDYAESLLIHLNRAGGEPMRVLAASDHLLDEPDGRRYTHACPLCGAPALHQDRYPRSVCDTCYARTVDSVGGRVTGANVSLSGGFIAYDAGTQDVNVEVTSTKRCWVDGHPCSIDEAHLGGVVVQAL